MKKAIGKMLAMMSMTTVFSLSTLIAQTTVIPDPIQSYKSNFWDSDVFLEAVPQFALGHQWGASMIDKVNTAFKMNVTCDNWGYLDTGAFQKMCKLGTGNSDTNYLVWSEALNGTPAPSMKDIFNDGWFGMRWEPAENAGLGREWQPRDDNAWPFGFLARYHGTIPTSQSDASYRRFKLDTTGITSNPIRVLDSVEPRNYIRMYRDVDWANPLEESFSNDTLFYEDSTDGRRLQLIVNLRRTNSTDTILDDEPVLSVVVPYQLRWKDQDPADSVNYHPNRFRMPFRLVPMADKDSSFDLPMSRGLEMQQQQPTGSYADSIVITRRMLPLHSDAGDPDVTFVAEFRSDTLQDFVLGIPIRRPHLLKSGYFDYPVGSDASTLTGPDPAGFHKRHKAIDSLGVTMWYHGNSAVAIRSASIVTPFTKRATSGYFDTAFANRFSFIGMKSKT